jgi:hypothetical protein
MEAISGVKLDTFFNQWFYGQGYPTYFTSYHQSHDTVNIKIRQITSHPSVPVYAMHLPFVLKSVSGKDTMLRLWNNDTLTSYTVTGIKFSADSLKFDPQWWIVAGNHSASYTGLTAVNRQSTHLILYPNPANALLHVVYPQNIAQYRVCDLAGRVLISGIMQGMEKQSTIDVHTLTPGCYCLQVTLHDGTVINAPWIKE